MSTAEDHPPRESTPEAREHLRVPCPGAPAIRLSVAPSLRCVHGNIWDASAAGVGVLVSLPMPVGARVALAWEFGPEHLWRIVLARAAHVTARARSTWLVGCTFESRLSDDVVAPLFR